MAGADRTGNTAFLLEGVLGVDEESITKDYELTSFSMYGRRPRDLKGGLGQMFEFVKGYPGATLRDQFESVLVQKFGVEPALIKAFRKAMLI